MISVIVFQFPRVPISSNPHERIPMGRRSNLGFDDGTGPTYWSCHKIPVMTKKPCEGKSVREMSEFLPKKIDRLLDSDLSKIVEVFNRSDLREFKSRPEGV